MSITLGILGAGLFAREAHLPALLQNDFHIAAICTRSPQTAQEFLAHLPYPAAVYHDLDAFLAHPDLQAVDIVLPIPLLPLAIKKALAAGLHVLSEKPIAPDTQSAQDLLASYAQHPAQVWMVGENWRYAPPLRRAAALIAAGAIGKVGMFYWAVGVGMNASNPYYQKDWRRAGAYQGGLLLDGGVHFIAGLRTVLGEVKSVQAYTRQNRADLPPLDTLTATVEMESGCIGTLSFSYAVGLPWTTFLTIVGEQGVIEVNLNTLRLTQNGAVTEELQHPGRSLEHQMAAFAAAVAAGKATPTDPAQALQDLAVIESLLGN